MFKLPFKRKSNPETPLIPTTKNDKYVKFFDEFLTEAKNNFLEEIENPGGTNNDFDAFKQERTLGMGTFGRVVLVRKFKDNKCFAMKILEKEKLVKLKQIDHTLNEKQILQAANLHFIVTLDCFFKVSYKLLSLKNFQKKILITMRVNFQNFTLNLQV